MPFNSETYAITKARRDRDQHMAHARRAAWAAETTDDGAWYKAHQERARFHVRSARWANTHLRFAKRIKALTTGT